MFMFSPAIRKSKIPAQKKLNLKQDLFCKVFATDPTVMGNGTQAYMKAYGVKFENAKAPANKFLLKPEITAKINEYLELDGFNDQTVDTHHLFLIRQKKDMNVSMKGIQEYNKLKKRITNTLEIRMPKPLLGGDLDDDEVIHKIDKKKVVEAEPE